MTEKKGYQTPRYKWSKSLSNYKKTGYFRTKINGQGHDAGYGWSKEEKVDPYERKRKYSANSPSFDEGVYAYKKDAKSRALAKKMK